MLSKDYGRYDRAKKMNRLLGNRVKHTILKGLYDQSDVQINEAIIAAASLATSFSKDLVGNAYSVYLNSFKTTPSVLSMRDIEREVESLNIHQKQLVIHFLTNGADSIYKERQITKLYLAKLRETVNREKIEPYVDIEKLSNRLKHNNHRTKNNSMNIEITEILQNIEKEAVDEIEFAVNRFKKRSNNCENKRICIGAKTDTQKLFQVFLNHIPSSLPFFNTIISATDEELLQIIVLASVAGGYKKKNVTNAYYFRLCGLKEALHVKSKISDMKNRERDSKRMPRPCKELFQQSLVVFSDDQKIIATENNVFIRNLKKKKYREILGRRLDPKKLALELARNIYKKERYKIPSYNKDIDTLVSNLWDYSQRVTFKTHDAFLRVINGKRRRNKIKGK